MANSCKFKSVSRWTVQRSTLSAAKRHFEDLGADEDESLFDIQFDEPAFGEVNSDVSNYASSTSVGLIMSIEQDEDDTYSVSHPDRPVVDICGASIAVDDAFKDQNDFVLHTFDVNHVNDNNDIQFSSGSDSDTSSSSQTVDLRSDLADWAVSFDVKDMATAGLLKVLRKHGHANLPKDPRTLKNTNTTYISDIHDIAGGKYYHFGIETCILKKLEMYRSLMSLDVISSLRLRLNIDGLPLCKSTNGQFWPILGLIEELPKKDPFIIGLFYGNSKPKDVAAYLHPFIVDMNVLAQTGLNISGQNISLSISTVICDTPARAFVKSVKGHSGYYGCDKCKQTGIHFKGRMTFPETAAALRLDSDFDDINCDFEEHHTGPCVWLDLKIGMVSQFPIDYMHLVCLGVTRRLINLWKKGPLATRLCTRDIDSISKALGDLRPSVPKDFARKPRSLAEVDRWKATEFRQFLLYTGMVVLQNTLPHQMYEHFLFFVVAIRLLISPGVSETYCDYAHSLLVEFVEYFGVLYGKEMVVYNVHCLVHLAAEVRLHGCLDNISAFPFESFLGRVKRLVRQPNHPLQQVIRRLSEQSTLNKDAVLPEVDIVKRPHSNGPLPIVHSLRIYKQYSELHLALGCITCSVRDNCVKVGEKICLVQNIIITETEKFVVVKFYHTQCNFFIRPLPSSAVGIFKVCNVSSDLHLVKVNEIVCKYVLLRFGDNDNKTVAVPLLHSEQ